VKRGLFIISLIFSVTFAVILGLRVSTDALAVITGVVLGVVASVPTTLLVIYFLFRQRDKADQLPYPPAQHPPVVVINASDKPQGYAPPALPPVYPSNGGRKWTVIGDEETDS